MRRLVGYPDDGYEPEVVWLDHARLEVASEVKPGDAFEYVFDLGDNWRHRCLVESDTADRISQLPRDAADRPREPALIERVELDEPPAT